jgi:hypothetical protein
MVHSERFEPATRKGEFMACNTAWSCPFSKRACTECGIYRGRHHAWISRRRHERSFERGEARERSRELPLSIQFQALRGSIEPDGGRSAVGTDELRIRLKVVYAENGRTEMSNLDGAKKWDWTDPKIWRLIDGRQITGLASLIDIVYAKAERGCEEVEVYEAPRFMLLAGG